MRASAPSAHTSSSVQPAASRRMGSTAATRRCSAVTAAGLFLTVATVATSQTLAITGATVIDGTGRPPVADVCEIGGR